MLKRIGVEVRTVFDTQVAHQLLVPELAKTGTGLSNVLSHWLDLNHDKGGPRMRRFMKTPHAWATRPLPAYVLEYAYNDVIHLPRLATILLSRANELEILDEVLACSIRRNRLNQQLAMDDVAKASGGQPRPFKYGPIERLELCYPVGQPSGLNLAGRELVTIRDVQASSFCFGSLAMGDAILAVNGVSCCGTQAVHDALRSAPGIVRLLVRRRRHMQSEVQVAVHDEPLPPILMHKPESSLAFARALAESKALREKCATRSMFAAAYGEWKSLEFSAGRLHTISLDKLLYHLRFRTYAKNLRDADPVLALRVAFSRGSDLRIKLAHSTPQELLDSQKTRIESDKHGIHVSHMKFDVLEHGSCTTHSGIVYNRSNHIASIVQARLLRGNQGFELVADVPQDSHVPMQPDTTWTFAVKTQPRIVGVARDILSISFKIGRKRFSIGRYLEMSCGDAELSELLKPSSKYVRPKRQRHVRSPTKDEVRAPAPERPPRPPPVVPLKQFKLEESGWTTKIKQGLAEMELMRRAEQLASVLEGRTAINVYQEHFRGLLYIEETQLLADLSCFDMVEDRATSLTQHGRLHFLEVPGLAENRPSVLLYDSISVKKVGTTRRYEGRVEKVELARVGIALAKSFAYTPGEKVEVQFRFNRLSMRRFHQGLSHVGNLVASILFPAQEHLATSPEPRLVDGNSRPFNRTLNHEQRQAVAAIVRAPARNVPYVLFGPPGTGKTTTLVEAILQCARFLQPTTLAGVSNASRDIKRFHILVCAPTNAAANLICCRLAEVLAPRTELMRVVAKSQSLKQLPEVLRDPQRRFTNWDPEEDSFTMHLDDLIRPIVLVATMATAAGLINEGVERGHFDLIVLDESGQAIEPEAVAPVACLLGDKGQLVLAGDPKQLGPIIHHDLAAQHGLAKSFMERLMDRPLYARLDRGDGRCEYNTDIITKLIRNYRSHPQLLEVPNRLFYDDELLSLADRALISSCLKWEELPVHGVPLLWHGVVGRDTREEKSPSWFNPDEIFLVVHYVSSLLQMRPQLKASDIGIISPYSKQVQKIQLALQHKRLGNDIKVGSVEKFQGDEHRVIIISTVRSSSEWTAFDRSHNLGFLDNPKRFNVATTRARALMIIVGNPNVLQLDPCWNELLRTCITKGVYLGPPIEQPDAENDDAEFVQEILAEEEELDGSSAQHRLHQELMQMPRGE